MNKLIESTFINPKTNQPFVLWRFQSDLLNFIEQNDKVMIVKSRQMGITNILVLWSLVKCFSIPNYKIIFVSANPGSMEHCHSLAKSFIASSDEKFITGKDIKMKVDTANESIAFENGARISFRPCNEKFLRGMESDVIIMDETPFNNNGEKVFINAINSSIKPKYKIILASTPAPYPSGKFFYNEFKNCLEGKSDFLFKKICWYMNPEFNITETYVDWQTNKWATNMFKTLGGDAFRQEILCEFIDDPVSNSHQKQMFNFRIEKHLIDAFKTCADREGRSYSEILRSLIIDYIYSAD